MQRLLSRRGASLSLGWLAGVLLGFLAACGTVPPPPPSAPPPLPAIEAPEPEKLPPPLPLALEPRRFARITQVANREIAAGHLPGAVILVGHQGRIVYRQAFGHRALLPRREPMTEDTIFDLASLTKVLATTTAIMQLKDAKRLDLDAPAARYWPEFGKNGKKGITIRQLLTHTSGLRAEVNSRVKWWGYEGALAAIAGDFPVRPPGSAFHYSDVNFIVLGEIVRRVSGLSLEVYCAQKIFRPMGLKDTSFRPRGDRQGRIAPTDFQGDRLRWGEVHDPTAHRMGGVAGHAGVFSTADDLAVFCQMLLDRGVSRGQRILSETAVTEMIKPHQVPGSPILRGLGWDIRSPLSRLFNEAFPLGSFGHTGYTGTSLWIDPKSRTFLIILTNRVHPHGRGQVKTLRAQTAQVVAQALGLGPPAGALAALDPELDLLGSGAGLDDGPERVLPGLEVLAEQEFAPLRGKNVGLITNHTGLDGQGRSAIELLRWAPGVRLKAIFSPEHGLGGNLDQKVPSGRDPATGLPVYSLYGEVKKPTPRMLAGLDALIYDIQDVGVRYYTYITTMAYAMEAAAAASLEFYVLDRPDPITGAMVQGPLLEPGLRSFIGYYPLPVRYGMTPGELARFFNQEARIGVKLRVVPMKGYRRELWFDQTGLPWINPSPNLRSLNQALLYAGVGLVESANVSVGRGTPWPFEVVGAPWISSVRLTEYLRRRNLKGIALEPVSFVPQSGLFRGQRCEGVRLRVMSRDDLDAPALGVELAAALYRLYPSNFQVDRTLYMLGSREVLQAIKNGVDPQVIRQRWQPALEAFRRLRQKYLLY